MVFPEVGKSVSSWEAGEGGGGLGGREEDSVPLGRSGMVHLVLEQSSIVIDDWLELHQN